MLRLLALLLLALLIWMVLSRLLAWLLPSPAPRRRGGAAGAGSHAGGRRPVEKLLRCDACGVRVPESRVLVTAGGGEVYCSESCRRRTVRDSA